MKFFHAAADNFSAAHREPGGDRHETARDTRDRQRHSHSVVDWAAAFVASSSAKKIKDDGNRRQHDGQMRAGAVQSFQEQSVHRGGYPRTWSTTASEWVPSL